MAFKDILKDLREEYCLTQKQIAAECGLSAQCISQLELGIRNPTGSTLVALAAYFDCSIDYLMGRSENPDNIDLTPPFGDQKKINPTDQKELWDIYNKLPKEYRIQILEYARYIAERHKNAKTISKK